jgi:hypothetical protein
LRSARADPHHRQKAESAQWSGIINAANARRNDWLARWQERTAELEQERPAYELPDELPSRIPQLHEWSALVHEVLEDESEMPMVLDAEDVEIKVSICVCLCEISILMACSSDRLDSPKYLCCDTLLGASYPLLGRNILRLYAGPPQPGPNRAPDTECAREYRHYYTGRRLCFGICWTCTRQATS